MAKFRYWHGDCLKRIQELDDDSVDSIITDPPYGLNFMGKLWDHGVPGIPFWKEMFRILKPGGHLLAFGGTRTYHRLACAIEDAGFEIRDSIDWIYGSGFPKSQNVGKMIDKAAGADRKVVGKDPARTGRLVNQRGEYTTSAGWSAGNRTDEITVGESGWDGWGTALKPAHEPIVMARKPLGERTVAKNVLKHGTGALNIDATRIAHGEDVDMGAVQRQHSKNPLQIGGARPGDELAMYKPGGRWPANVILSHADGCKKHHCVEGCPVAELDAHSGVSKSTGGRTIKRSGGGNVGSGKASEKIVTNDDPGFGDTGGASRFFYVAKASRSERNAGVNGPEKPLLWSSGKKNPGSFQSNGTKKAATNNHPTVKPVKLMQYLVKLVTPPDGTVLDPFMGSGTTGVACVKEHFSFIGIEKDKDYLKIAKARIRHALDQR